MRLCESHTHNVALELNVTGRDRVRLDVFCDLTAGVADLTNAQTAMCLALRRELFEGFETLTLWFFRSRYDGVAGSFELVEFNHDIAGEDRAELAFAPSLVDIDQVVCGNAALAEVLGVP